MKEYKLWIAHRVAHVFEPKTGINVWFQGGGLTDGALQDLHDLCLMLIDYLLIVEVTGKGDVINVNVLTFIINNTIGTRAVDYWRWTVLARIFPCLALCLILNSLLLATAKTTYCCHDSNHSSNTIIFKKNLFHSLTLSLFNFKHSLIYTSVVERTRERVSGVICR